MDRSFTIGIVSPSAPTASSCPRRFDRAVSELEEIGFQVKVGEYAKKETGFTAGSPSERSKDLLEMFLDPQVDIIMPTIGGYNSNDLLLNFDFEKIQREDTLFVGYSDNTILLHSLWVKSSVRTIHGPMLLPQFGELGGVHDFTKENFLQVITSIGSNESVNLPVSNEWTDEYLAWDKEDNRARNYRNNDGWSVIQEGCASGVLVAGNLNTLITLTGTEFFVDEDELVLFLEDVADQKPACIKRNLVHLRLSCSSQISAIVLGRFPSSVGVKHILDGMMQEIFPNIPIISGVDFGHTDPVLSLPIESEVEVDTSAPRIRIRL